MNTKAKGYLLGAVAAATYGMNPLFALPLYKAGMDPDSVLFFRYLFAIPLLGIMLKARGRDFKLHRREIVPLVLLGLPSVSNRCTGWRWLYTKTRSPSGKRPVQAGSPTGTIYRAHGLLHY